MKYPILYSFKRYPYAMRARMALQLTNIKCEIREVRLNNKPKHMLEVSPKGTVPVLILNERTIEESMEVIDWALDQKNVFEGNLKENQIKISNELIERFDDKFKYHLDRYKYASRYEDVDEIHHRKKCEKILLEIEDIISDEEWFFGKKINKLDISILPFIRQFRIADPNWFDNHNGITKVKNYLHNFLASKILKDVMINYDVWKEESEISYFPITNR